MNALLREELLNYRRDLRDHDIADDPSGLFDVAHRLHGAAAICQLTMLEEEAAHLEATARSGEFDERQRAIRIVLRRIDEILAAPATASTATG
jgi:HPt (histidine-containing phosphotransfer) domain-containing protein